MYTKYFNLHRNLFKDDEKIDIFFSPGRVNFIGEHIDYNGGNVFPFAISLGNYGTFSFRKDREIHLFSDSFPEQGIFKTSLDDLKYKKEDDWANYVKGVILYLQEASSSIHQGFNIAISSTLPSGAGLSSSASIEALIAVMMNDMFDLGLDRTYLSVLTQRVENKYIDVNCGIMDQFVILNGEKDSALMLNTSTLKFDVVPFQLKNETVVIINSKKRRGLVESAYNDRRNECASALEFFKQYIDVFDLCSITIDQYNEYAPLCSNPVWMKRAKHAITEQARVFSTKLALEQNDLMTVGQNLLASHHSLRDDFQVSVKELDLLVSLAMKHGAIGARMTGAGFGGCTVNIVKNDLLDHFIKSVTDEYFNQTGYLAEMYIAMPSNKTSRM
ncbi:MAG: galactokinase [Candidatus Izemoplasmatales bacterium]